MRRENRRKKDYNLKSLVYITGSILGVTVIVFVITFVVYGNKLNENAKQSMMNTAKISDLVPSVFDGITEASSEIGKSVKEQVNSITNDIVKEQENKTQQISNTQSTSKPEVKKPEVIKDPEFIKPVEGEIIKDYAKDNLVYSETLDEWITHLGIDIQADKTTVVKAASDGKIKSIKNDPRYGLSIVIEHVNNFTSVYSNLLSTEFVTIGETVKQGQSIGTVGNTSVFEIADGYHLHFEILKENENLDPKIYI